MAGGFVAQDDAGETIVRGAQCTDALAVLPAATASGEIAALSRVVSFDQDGFTLETTHLASELPLAVLALEGGDYTVGLGSASSRATKVGFEPAGALLFGTGLTAVSRSRDFGRLCVGGFSRDQRAGCVSWSTPRPRPPGPRSQLHQRSRLRVIDTTSGELHARATLSAIGRRRFSLGWRSRIAGSQRLRLRRVRLGASASRRWATGYACWAAAARCANSASSTGTATGVAASGSATL